MLSGCNENLAGSVAVAHVCPNILEVGKKLLEAVKELRLFGAGIVGRTIADLVKWQFSETFELIGAYDDSLPAGSEVTGGLRILGTVSEGLTAPENGSSSFFVSIGSRHRASACRIFIELLRAQKDIATLVSS